LAAYAESRELGDADLKNLSHWAAKAHIPDTGLEKAIFGENQKGDEFLRSLGSFAPYAKLGGLAKGLTGLAKRGGATAAY
ncbi:hypothetical protein NL351_30225, partial [Klebsiella pneumoniae]|nr:hypothetical protein [Klebsiella pneumoniae]